MTRIGIKERHIIREPGKGSSDVGAKAVSLLLEKPIPNRKKLIFSFVQP